MATSYCLSLRVPANPLEATISIPQLSPRRSVHANHCLFCHLAIVLMMAFVVACGEAATPEPTNTPIPPTEAPAPTEAMEEEPTAMMEEEEDAMEGDAMMWEISDELKAYAAEHAGGPGAIYIGDGNLDTSGRPGNHPGGPGRIRRGPGRYHGGR